VLKLKKIALITVLTTFVLSCQQNKNGLYKITNNNICFNISDDKVCVPKKWQLKKQSRYLILCSINSADTSEYFVVLKHNKLSSGITLNTYLKEIYKALRNDTVEIASGYTSQKLTGENEITYYSEFHTTLNGKPYITLSMIFQDKSNIYEFALKTSEKNFSNNKIAFRNTLFESRMDHHSGFNKNDKFLKIEIVDLSKI
jgi:hypothetical protein